MSATVSSQTLPALSQTSQFCIPFWNFQLFFRGHKFSH